MNKNKKQNKDEYKFTQETRKILCFYQNVIELKKKNEEKNSYKNSPPQFDWKLKFDICVDFTWLHHRWLKSFNRTQWHFKILTFRAVLLDFVFKAAFESFDNIKTFFISFSSTLYHLLPALSVSVCSLSIFLRTMHFSPLASFTFEYEINRNFRLTLPAFNMLSS